MRELIQDPRFRVELDLRGCSPMAADAIWYGQHVCVSEGFALDDPLPSDPAGAVIHHQFKPKHWGVLNWGFAVLHFGGFPHDTVMQMVRHQDPDELVQSNRYTGKRYITLAKIPEAEAMTHVEDLFYVKPAGRYSTRSGSYTVTEAQRNETLRECWQSCEQYRVAVEEWGWPEEDARRKLNGAFRQNFTMSGTLADHFHWLDQRTLDDTQIECQTLAYMALGKLEAWSPGLFGWYRANRAGKNLLAP